MLSVVDTATAHINAKNKQSQVEKEFSGLATNNKSFSAASYPPKEGEEGFPGVRSNFHWDNTTDEPHKTRRKLILQKYPEIKELFGYCWKTKYSVLFLVSVQFAFAYYLKDKMWTMEYWVICTLRNVRSS
jgi:hypothetical protein